MSNNRQTRELTIQLPSAELQGNLNLIESASGLVVFAHGSGSSRFSPRNQYVASALNAHHLSTLLFDLLTAEEDVIDQRTSEYRFDISLLAQRLIDTTDWLISQPDFSSLNIGYFGSSTGAAAALIAAAARPKMTKAVVSRGGRPDLAEEALGKVQASTLLIVGGLDDVVIDLNEQAKAKMHCDVELDIIPGATHLFEEPGKLDEVNRLATEWFTKYLTVEKS